MWTRQRVKLLTKLWKGGLSASKIAKVLGNTTRNAVIGKVHRLGLLRTRYKDIINSDILLYDSKLITLINIKKSMCKWPLGDPKSKDFHFCGEQCYNSMTYCEQHMKMAYRSINSTNNVEKKLHYNYNYNSSFTRASLYK